MYLSKSFPIVDFLFFKIIYFNDKYAIMRLQELFEAPRSWANILQDAERRGLKIINHSNTKKPIYFLTVDEETREAAEERLKQVAGSVPTHEISNAMYQKITVPTYPKVADELELLVKNIDAWAEEQIKKRAAKAYDALQSMKERAVAWTVPPYQLFIPRTEWMQELHGKQWIRDFEREEREKVKEYKEAPLIPKVSPHTSKGGSKPENAFWTSSLQKGPIVDGKQTYSSDWAQFSANANKKWWSPYGYVYKYAPKTTFLHLNTTQDAMQLYEIYLQLEGKAMPDMREPRYHLLTEFPWDFVNRHFDAVFHNGIGRYDSWENFTSNWDVESTAWLNTGVLTLIGRVPIAPLEFLSDPDRWDDDD